MPSCGHFGHFLATKRTIKFFGSSSKCRSLLVLTAGFSGDSKADSYLSELRTEQESSLSTIGLTLLLGIFHFGITVKKIKESATSFRKSATVLSAKQDIAYLGLSWTESSFCFF